MLPEAIRRNPTAVLAYQHMPGTLPNLIEKIGMSRTTVRHAVTALKNGGLIHIAAYQLIKNSQRPIFNTGCKDDARKTPASELSRIRNARYNKKRRLAA